MKEDLLEVRARLGEIGARAQLLERAVRDLLPAVHDDDARADLLELLDDNLQVVLLTGRPIRVQAETLAWLHRYDLRWDLLIMRDFGDYMAAREFKQYTVDDLRRYGFDLRLAFEDDRRNLEMFRAEGIPSVYIHSGYFE